MAPYHQLLLGAALSYTGGVRSWEHVSQLLIQKVKYKKNLG